MGTAQLAHGAELPNPDRHSYEVDNAPTPHVLGSGVLPLDGPILGTFMVDDNHNLPGLCQRERRDRSGGKGSSWSALS